MLGGGEKLKLRERESNAKVHDDTYDEARRKASLHAFSIWNDYPIICLPLVLLIFFNLFVLCKSPTQLFYGNLARLSSVHRLDKCLKEVVDVALTWMV